MPFNLLLLPLLGGYIFLLFFIPTRYFLIRQQGYHLIFFSAIAGMVFLLVAYIITTIVSGLFPALVSQWHVFLPYDYSGTALTAFSIGVLLQLILNVFIKKKILFPEASYFQNKALMKYGSRLEQLFEKSLVEKKEVSLTLKNQKVYIGLITGYPLPEEVKGAPYISMLPYFSGYRDSETKRLTLLTSYLNVYEQFDELNKEDPNLSAGDFEIVIPVSEILTANIFNQKVYDHFPGQFEG